MEPLAYHLKANLVFTLLLLTYALVMRRETWFTARRGWLLCSAAVALVLPLLPVSTTGPSALIIELPEVRSSANTLPEATLSWAAWIIMAHVAISLLLLARLALRTVRSFRAFNTVTEACSFFNKVHIPERVPKEEHAAMSAHEQVHIRQGHSFDVVAFEILGAIYWSNPLWREALRELRLVHEHAADAEAKHLHAGYDQLLLAEAMNAPTDLLVNSFRSSNLKTRIAMMYNTRSPRLARRKLLIALPTLLLAIVLVSWQAAPRPITGKHTHDAMVFAGVDQQPEFPGGMEALMAYLSKNVVYPEAARKEGIEGKVFVGFTVKADGSIADVKALRGVRTDLDNEAIRVVRSMPKWKPATSKGKPTEATMTLPIAFALGVEK